MSKSKPVLLNTPWTLELDEEAGSEPLIEVIDSQRNKVCQLYSHGEIKPAKAFRSSEANAKLIAAAPDLLEACKAALEANRMRSDGYVKQLADAIAKAGGETDEC